ncbi:uncharacterized protein LOC110031332 [Phalaenopsis equestris]|uniref:uncharacterized protein LOC110031332 n=1 Tax=Phalaenopsis equestris TaxID=78828 RepID=UPI0009E2380B|nr:uncharacterized protein LOC110031332 [Phalaenopsis equestris]
MKSSIDRESKDILIVKKKVSQSLSAAIANFCFPQHRVSWSNCVWNKFLSPSMSFFSWRLLHGFQPTDDILKLKGLRGPSRCGFCKSHEEIIKHLFFQCSTVKKVWNCLIPKLKLETVQLSWNDFSLSWKDWQDQDLPPIPYITAWFIWMAKNKIKYEDIWVAAATIATNCISYLQKLYCHGKLPDILHSTSHSIPRKIKFALIHWDPPPKGGIKVNTDGSFSNPYAGIGGVFRNNNGKCLLYFHSPVIAKDPLEAETVAIYWAMFMAQKCGFTSLILESDSRVLIDIIEGRLPTPWYLLQ